MPTRHRRVKNFSLSEECFAWLEIKRAQGYNMSRLIEKLILTEVLREAKEQKLVKKP